jgi:hypothetical protein
VASRGKYRLGNRLPRLVGAEFATIAARQQLLARVAGSPLASSLSATNPSQLFCLASHRFVFSQSRFNSSPMKHSSIPGYAYGQVSRSPVTLEDLKLLKQTVLFSAADVAAPAQAG